MEVKRQEGKMLTYQDGWFVFIFIEISSTYNFALALPFLSIFPALFHSYLQMPICQFHLIETYNSKVMDALG